MFTGRGGGIQVLKRGCRGGANSREADRFRHAMGERQDRQKEHPTATLRDRARVVVSVTGTRRTFWYILLLAAGVTGKRKMRTSILMGLMACLMLASPAVVVPASAQVGTVVAGGVIAREAFGELRKSLQDIIASAEAAGNRLIQRVAEAALDTIDAMETSAGNLIDQSFDNLDRSIRFTFNEIQNLARRIEDGQAVLMEDATSLTAQWAGVVGALPFSSTRHDVYMFTPRVAAPVGNETLRVRVIGPGIGGASPAAQLNGTDLEVIRASQNEVQIGVPRAMLEFGPGNSFFARVAFSFDEVRPGWIFNRNPARVEREFDIWLLPVQIGIWELQQTVERPNVERMAFRTEVSSGGRDARGGAMASVRPDHYEQGWRLDTRTLGRLVDQGSAERNWHGFVSGRAMTCLGPDMDTAVGRRVHYAMQFGHYRDRNNPTHRRGGFGTCYINLPLVRTVTSKETIRSSGELDWAAEQLVELDAGVQTWRLSIELFDGRTVQITPDTSLPSMDIDIQRAPDHFVLRPIRPRDF